MFGSNHRRKVQCACYPCVKAKRGCDLERPCSRCVKKGIPEQCLEKKDHELFFNSPSLLNLNAKQDSNQEYEEEDRGENQNIKLPIPILNLSDASPQEEYTDQYSHDEDLQEMNYANNSALEYPFVDFKINPFSFLNNQEQDESLTMFKSIRLSLTLQELEERVTNFEIDPFSSNFQEEDESFTSSLDLSDAGFSEREDRFVF
jgi:hypothetical protein